MGDGSPSGAPPGHAASPSAACCSACSACSACAATSPDLCGTADICGTNAACSGSADICGTSSVRHTVQHTWDHLRRLGKLLLLRATLLASMAFHFVQVTPNFVFFVFASLPICWASETRGSRNRLITDCSDI